MAADPRRAIVEVMARLGRETQLHLDERQRHFRITDAVIVAISLILIVLAVINIYFVRVLYTDLNGIVTNMESMYVHLRSVDEDMVSITSRVESFDNSMTYMTDISANMVSLADTLPEIRGHMDAMRDDMGIIATDMGLMSEGMGNIDVRFHAMTGGVSLMRQNVRQISGPMGSMNPFMP